VGSFICIHPVSFLYSVMLQKQFTIPFIVTVVLLFDRYKRNKKFWEELIAYFPWIQQRLHRKQKN
jgi:hypothetical protein